MTTTPRPPGKGPCRGCGRPGASAWVEDTGPWCHDCWMADAWAQDFPALPDPPPSVTFTGPDGRSHRLRYQLHRDAAGIHVQLRESDLPAGIDPATGYAFAVLGDHHAAVAELVAAAYDQAGAAIARCYLRPRPGIDPQLCPDGETTPVTRVGRWMLAGDDVAGRLVPAPPPRA